jgi:anaerobic magnesium-protoporphyrin IX monomethyl ester cyclase
MRVCLVRPYHRSHLIQPPLALGYLAAQLVRDGHSVRVIDALQARLDNEAIIRRCDDAELVGISVLTDYARTSFELARRLKQRARRVVLGGPHVTALPLESLRESGADHVVVGEGERALSALVRALESGATVDVPGVLSAGADVVGPRAPMLENLDELPFPDWSEIPPASYPPAPHGGVARAYPIAPMTTTRGCPYDCAFCASPELWQRRIRFRSPENVVEEAAEAVRRYGVRELHFEDDNLTLRREHAAAIAEGLLRRDLRLSWATPNGIRVDAVDRELLTLMKRSGCYSVAFGIESADEQILRRCGKRTSLPRIEQAIADAAEVGLITQGFFIFGLPGESEATIARTIDFARHSRLDKAQFLLLDVIPGSRFWRELGAQHGRHQSFHDVSWCPEGLDPEVLRRAPSRAFRAFFASPRRIYRMARLVRLSQLRYVLRRLLDFRVLPGRS